MSNLKDLRTQKKSVQSTQKITSAMKMVAGAKLRRLHLYLLESQEALIHIRSIFSRLISYFPDIDPLPFFLEPPSSNEKNVHLLVVITSDRGLCGAFNSNLLRGTKKFMEAQKGTAFQLLCIGKKGFEAFNREHHNLILEHFSDLGRPRLTFTESEEIAQFLLDHFKKGTFQSCTLIYNKFKNAIMQEIVFEPLIPVEILEHPDGDLQGRALYTYEPDIETLLKTTFSFLIKTQVHQAILNSQVGEQGARMAAMDNATRNADQMIKKLELTYNRMRQAYITKELIEIISGAEAI